MSINRNLRVTFISILLLSAFGNPSILKHIPEVNSNQVLLYSIHILSVLVTMLIDYSFWKSYPQKWPVFVWLFLYFSAGLFYLIIGIIHLFIFPLSYAALKDISQLRFFLLSPLPFVLLYFSTRLTINTKLSKKLVLKKNEI